MGRTVGDWLIEPLNRVHQKESFGCGTPDLDEYLKKYARQNDEKGVGRTTVACRVDNPLQVVGFYTLSAGSVVFSSAPLQIFKGIPRYPVPVAHLGRLAVDRAERGKGLGTILLMDSIRTTVEAASFLAIFAIEVKAKDETAARFYRERGFHPLVENILVLYLSMVEARAAIALAEVGGSEKALDRRSKVAPTAPPAPLPAGEPDPS